MVGCEDVGPVGQCPTGQDHRLVDLLDQLVPQLLAVELLQRHIEPHLSLCGWVSECALVNESVCASVCVCLLFVSVCVFDSESVRVCEFVNVCVCVCVCL